MLYTSLTRCANCPPGEHDNWDVLFRGFEPCSRLCQAQSFWKLRNLSQWLYPKRKSDTLCHKGVGNSAVTIADTGGKVVSIWFWWRIQSIMPLLCQCFHSFVWNSVLIIFSGNIFTSADGRKCGSVVTVWMIWLLFQCFIVMVFSTNAISIN